MNWIVDLFIAAFENSNNAIKDVYDSQIKQYDHTLNEYTKQTAYGKKHFFGTAEISQMFESATPELLRKIAGVVAEHGCKDVKEWVQKSPWYREFELGREAGNPILPGRRFLTDCRNFVTGSMLNERLLIKTTFTISTNSVLKPITTLFQFIRGQTVMEG